MARPTQTPLNALRTFDAAVRHEGFSRAAGELHVTPAAISHRIKELEDALGVALFVRHRRGVTLTDIGRRYHESVSVALNAIDRASRACAEPSVAGPLTVSMPESFATRWLSHRLAQLATDLPGLELSIHSDSRLVDLREGPADIGVRFGMGHYAGVDAELLMGDAVSVLAPKRLIGERAETHADSIMANCMLLEDADLAAGQPWMSWPPWLREAGLDTGVARTTLRFTSAGSMLAACEAGAGLCVSRLSLTYEQVAKHELIPLLPWRSTEFSYHLVRRPADRNDARINAFERWLRDAVSDFQQDAANGPVAR